MLRTEVGKSITGTPSNFKQLDKVALGLYQMAVDSFGMDRNGKEQGIYEGLRYSSILAKRYLLVEDIVELIQDAESLIFREAIKPLLRTGIEYKFCYKLLPNYDILIGFDPREFEDDPLPNPVYRHYLECLD